jgi:hypothetical protein
MRRQAYDKKDVVLLRNARRVAQKAPTHPALRPEQVPFVSEYNLLTGKKCALNRFLSREVP